MHTSIHKTDTWDKGYWEERHIYFFIIPCGHLLSKLKYSKSLSLSTAYECQILLKTFFHPTLHMWFPIFSHKFQLLVYIRFLKMLEFISEENVRGLCHSCHPPLLWRWFHLHHPLDKAFSSQQCGTKLFFNILTLTEIQSWIAYLNYFCNPISIPLWCDYENFLSILITCEPDLCSPWPFLSYSTWLFSSIMHLNLIYTALYINLSIILFNLKQTPFWKL